MRTLKESILDDIDVTLQAGDNYAKMTAKIEKGAEKEWQKFLNSNKSSQVGPYRSFNIKCPNLAKYLALETNFNKIIKDTCARLGVDYDNKFEKIDSIWCKIRLADGNDTACRRAIYIQLHSEQTPLGGFVLPYCNDNENIKGGLEVMPYTKMDTKRQKETIRIVLSNIKDKYATAKDFRDALHELHVTDNASTFDLYDFYGH